MASDSRTIEFRGSVEQHMICGPDGDRSRDSDLDLCWRFHGTSVSVVNDNEKEFKIEREAPF